MRVDPIFVLVGPSASGKSTVAQMLVERLGVRRAVTTTTRHQRRGEPFDAYHFVTLWEFNIEDMVEYKDYANNRYGLTKSEADASNLVIMEPVGAQRLQAYCREKGRQCYLIGMPVSKKEQAERMAQRGDPASLINERIAYDEVAFEHLASVCTTVCKAENVESLYKQIEEFILSHSVDRMQDS